MGRAKEKCTDAREGLVFFMKWHIRFSPAPHLNYFSHRPLWIIFFPVFSSIILSFLPGECHFVRGTPWSIPGQLMMLARPATSGRLSLLRSGWESLVCGCSCGRRRPLGWCPSLPLRWLLKPEQIPKIPSVKCFKTTMQTTILKL